MKKIEIPSFLSHLPVDQRGYPIPFFVAYTEPGKPDFRLLDAKKQFLCLNQNLCGICGKKIEGVNKKKAAAFVIGGPLTAMNKVCSDPPMHRQCAEYSLKTCPHLFYKDASRRESNMNDAAQENKFLVKTKPNQVLLIRIAKWSPFFIQGQMLIKFKSDLIEVYEYDENGLLNKVQSDEQK